MFMITAISTRGCLLIGSRHGIGATVGSRLCSRKLTQRWHVMVWWHKNTHDIPKSESLRYVFVIVSYATSALLAVVWHWFFMFDGYSYFFLLCLSLLN